ncbi:hypothetical protein M8C21_011159 [Ambrosia artemisiifolia]|uniref:Uncharacterized protein n=1 Tax=Ambrosia artemisiifolia TaxID=4212 RepID=A0AAD5BPR9_AMBAR|nr:hypothetical protein M8C21_011159 [Ambrosia artemisiifolia]
MFLVIRCSNAGYKGWQDATCSCHFVNGQYSLKVQARDRIKLELDEVDSKVEVGVSLMTSRCDPDDVEWIYKPARENVAELKRVKVVVQKSLRTLASKYLNDVRVVQVE